MYQYGESAYEADLSQEMIEEESVWIVEEQPRWTDEQDPMWSPLAQSSPKGQEDPLNLN